MTGSVKTPTVHIKNADPTVSEQAELAKKMVEAQTKAVLSQMDHLILNGSSGESPKKSSFENQFEANLKNPKDFFQKTATQQFIDSFSKPLTLSEAASEGSKDTLEQAKQLLDAQKKTTLSPKP